MKSNSLVAANPGKKLARCLQHRACLRGIALEKLFKFIIRVFLLIPEILLRAIPQTVANQ